MGSFKELINHPKQDPGQVPINQLSKVLVLHVFPVKYKFTFFRKKLVKKNFEVITSNMQ